MSQIYFELASIATYRLSTFRGFAIQRDYITSHRIANIYLSYYGVASGSEITPCNEIDKPPVVYRFSGNVIISITTFSTYDTIIRFLWQK